MKNSVPEQAVAIERDTCLLIADRLASRHQVAGESFFAISASERDLIISELRKAAALPLMGVKCREDVARAAQKVITVWANDGRIQGYPRDLWTNDLAELAGEVADAVFALLHMGQPQEKS